jgi:hypothetical protein
MVKEDVIFDPENVGFFRANAVVQVRICWRTCVRSLGMVRLPFY